MTQSSDDLILDSLSISSSLEADLAAAKKETTKDWTNIPLWRILAENPENPYGVRSKAGLRRLERAARKRALHKRKPGYNLDGSKRKPRRKKRGRPKGSKNKSSKAATTPKGTAT